MFGFQFRNLYSQNIFQTILSSFDSCLYVRQSVWPHILQQLLSEFNEFWLVIKFGRRYSHTNIRLRIITWRLRMRKLEILRISIHISPSNCLMLMKIHMDIWIGKSSFEIFRSFANLKFYLSGFGQIWFGFLILDIKNTVEYRACIAYE